MKNIGIGTYAFGMDSELSLLEKVQAAKKMGYSGIEFLAVDLQSHSVTELKEMLAANGMQAFSAHAGMDLIPELLPVMAELGAKMIVCPGYPFADEEEALACAKRLEEMGKMAAGYGLKVGYHNHTSEFYEVNGVPLLNLVIENTDPQYVYFQLDCGWATAAGINCPEYIRKYSGRFCAVHVKENNRVTGADKPQSAKEPKHNPFQIGPDGKPIITEELKKMFEAMKERMKIQCPLGDPSSLIDWKAVKEATDAQGIECLWIVEREYDYAGDILTCLAEDCAWLEKNL